MNLLDNTFYVINDVFDLDYQNYLEDVWQYTTPFYFHKSTLARKEDGVFDNDTLDLPHWSCKLNIDGEQHPTDCPPDLFNKVKEVLDKMASLKVKEVLRAHATITTPVRDGFRAERFHLPAHVDVEVPNSITCIYYVNDSDGDSILFEKPDKENWDFRSMLTETDRVSPKKGSMAFFKSDSWHAGSAPIFTKSRCVININLLLE